MHPVAIIFLVGGILQTVGALSHSKLYQVLPHFQRTKRLFGYQNAINLHAAMGILGAVVGLMMMTGVISFTVYR